MSSPLVPPYDELLETIQRIYRHRMTTTSGGNLSTLKALQNGYRALFIRAQDLFDEMYASLADRASRKLIRRLARIDVLLVDELAYLNLRPEQTNIFFKLMEERYRRKATVITTNLDYERWHQLLGNKDLTDALLSRLRHQCQTIRINGPSLREPQA